MYHLCIKCVLHIVITSLVSNMDDLRLSTWCNNVRRVRVCSVIVN